MRVMHVNASQEGLDGHQTSAGLTIHESARFVALPDHSALWHVITLIIAGHVLQVPVLDVGPWFTDDPYWQHDDPTPRAAKMKGQPHGNYTINGAGIDLSDGLLKSLGIKPTDWGVNSVLWYSSTLTRLSAPPS